MPYFTGHLKTYTDAPKIGVADNDWVEACNRNGVVACRAVVSHRLTARPDELTRMESRA